MVVWKPASDSRKLRQLEDENKRLKQLVAELTPDNQALQCVVEKTGVPPAKTNSYRTPKEMDLSDRLVCRLLKIFLYFCSRIARSNGFTKAIEIVYTYNEDIMYIYAMQRTILPYSLINGSRRFHVGNHKLFYTDIFNSWSSFWNL